MNIERLQYFLAAAHEENFTAAANALFISQAHLSREIKTLEEDLGTTLFIRGKRKTHLTPKGIIFRSYASEIIRLLEESKTELSVADQSLTGSISIGCTESVALRFFVSSCIGFKQSHPHVSFNYNTGTPDSLLKMLEDGLLDFAIIVGPSETDKFAHYTLPLFDTWGLLMKKGHPLCNKQTIHAQDLLGVPLLAPEPLMHHNILSSWAGDLMDSLKIDIVYDLIFTASLMVEEGFGCAIALSPLVDTPKNEPLIFRPLDPPMVDHLEMVWKSHRPLSKQADYLIRYIKKHIEEKTYTPTQFFID